MESTLARKITTNIFFYSLGYFYLFFILFVTCSQLFYLISHAQKIATHSKKKKYLKNHDN